MRTHLRQLSLVIRISRIIKAQSRPHQNKVPRRSDLTIPKRQRCLLSFLRHSFFIRLNDLLKSDLNITSRTFLGESLLLTRKPWNQALRMKKMSTSIELPQLLIIFELLHAYDALRLQKLVYFQILRFVVNGRDYFGIGLNQFLVRLDLWLLPFDSSELTSGLILILNGESSHL